MAHVQDNRQLVRTEEALIVLFCLLDDAYLCPHQPEGTALRVPQESLGLGGHHPRALPTASRRGVRALLPARRRPLLLAPVPRGGRSLDFLLAPSPAQAT